MADVVMTLVQLENFFQAFTCTLLGINGVTSPAAVRIGWQTGGPPGFTVSDDVVFVRVAREKTPYYLPDTQYLAIAGDNNHVNQRTHHSKLVHAYWTIYGPNSSDRAWLLRDVMKYQPNHDILARSNLYLVPQNYEPVRAPEVWPDQTQWWERSDIDMYFNELVVRDFAIGAVHKVPVTIVPDVGGPVSITIEES